jgi:hypothetical protein
MHPLLIISIALQVYCIFHAIRNNNTNWIFLLLAPGIGPLAYALSHIAPELFGSYGIRRTARGVLKKLDPERDMRKLDKNLARTDTVENRLQVANEALELKDYPRAEALFRESLVGLYEREPAIMLGLARAQFAQMQYQAARSTLEDLIAHNPNYQSADGHLLYARCLTELGMTQKACEEFEIVKNNFLGEEARYRYAELLQRLGRGQRAREILAELNHRYDVAPKHYQKSQREWQQKAAALSKSLDS